MARPKKLPRERSSQKTGKSRSEAGITLENPTWDVDRTSTRGWSFDQATGGGIPNRSITEIAGYEHVGKSTLGDHLCGVQSTNHIAMLALELGDPSYLVRNLTAVQFGGSVWFTPGVDDKGKPLDNEGMLDAFLDKIEQDETIGAALVDSVSAISPVGEIEGSVREARMGLKARIMASFMRRLENILLRRRVNPCSVFLVNHLHPSMGIPGANTSGGKAIHNHSATRLRLSLEEPYDDGSFLVSGKIVKLRIRGTAAYRANFKVVMKADYGVHIGLTAIQDCLDQGLAENKAGRISLGTKTFGFHKKMIEETFNELDQFQPFIAALRDYKG